ncbi:hypothetical protein BKA82DRAFT_261677 [Pisolithus tinctorius]|uniref:Uncharacterized protein n=1 Tax=Pisolithus tinctorius Marx 270 TaxID=870435 RepID=A0A0C3PL14_PISTI|nr:hypothetical protein BKA82DRAFT_261677 [Pisolithus tinctorius]KIO09381.1 hypothetical protein M404DRAFT_261677 [Pisolithus tinctorius Marx 270]
MPMRCAADLSFPNVFFVVLFLLRHNLTSILILILASSYVCHMYIATEASNEIGPIQTPTIGVELKTSMFITLKPISLLFPHQFQWSNLEGF